MNDWKKINCVIIILLGILSGFRYIKEYIDVLENRFLVDGIRFFFVAAPIAACHLILLFISINKRSRISAMLDVIVGFSQLLVIGFRGKIIPIYGMIMSGCVILLATLVLSIKTGKSSDTANHSASPNL